MISSIPHYFPSHRRPGNQGQGLAEYAILLAVIGVLAIAALMLTGGSVEGGLLKTCADLGNEDCQAAETGTVPMGTVTPTLLASATPSLVPTATMVPVDPDPTRPPVATIVVGEPTLAGPLVTMRVKVVVGGQGSATGIRVVVYNAGGAFVAQSMTDNKGSASFSVPMGSYTVATLYNDVWQTDGPFSVKNSKVNVINR